MDSYRLAVVGATGLVGREMIRLLELRDFPVAELIPLCSSRSEGALIPFRGDMVQAERLDRDRLQDADLVLASAGSEVSKLLRQWAGEDELVVVDNSSAFRMDPEVPLVVPEVNPHALQEHKGYIANPNCTTIQLAVVLKAIQDAAGLQQVSVSTYQSVSGSGNRAMEELATQTMGLLSEEPITPEVYPHRIAFNLIPQIGPVGELGYFEEEWKVIHESRKILEQQDLHISCTAVRVPTFACHGESVQVITRQPVSRDVLAVKLSEMPGLTVLDAPDRMVYPMPINTVESTDVFVGRLRAHPSLDRTFDLWIVADNLWKGAALNTIQILETMAGNNQL